jgi:hypothetical protein
VKGVEPIRWLKKEFIRLSARFGSAHHELKNATMTGIKIG